MTSNALTGTFLLLKLFFAFIIICGHASGFDENYANEWAVEIEGGDTIADKVAFEHGFINHGKVSWAEQQLIKRRVKRDLNYDPDYPPNDPRWSQMWYLLPQTSPSMRVVEAWKAGYSGRNVAVTILDDGIERLHPDLKDNYDPDASGDINSHDSDPTPRLNPSNENRHGTRCAGEVAAVANNGICCTGIAYNGKIGGVRMLDGSVTDSVEAASIGFNPDHVDIYSASWGPDDDGRTVDGPAKLAKLAFVNGVTKGRGGKGSIFVWASGNGGRSEDNCNCDGYTNSIFTLSISSTTQRKTKPWYSESCSSTLASTYSSGSQGDRQIVTTDLRHGCTSSHTGTSASAPLAAAICALALEANPALTWRDMQHLVVHTANSTGLIADDWITNGVNRKVSHAFGYGLMDAYAMVMKAKEWTLVPKQHKCVRTVVSEHLPPRIFTSGAPVIISFKVIDCDSGEMVDRLEHVAAELTIHNERRGDLQIHLTSPMGTKSNLLGYRRQDYKSQGFNKWAFMTTHSWDEDPKGTWTLEIHDRNSLSVSGGYYIPFHRGHPEYKRVKNSTLQLFNLIMYGTKNSDWSDEAKPQSDVSTTAKQQPLASSSTSKPSTTSRSTTKQVRGHGNCIKQLASGEGCLVCQLPYYLDIATHLCVSSCAAGHYQSYERVNEREERKPIQLGKSSEGLFEAKEQEAFEDEERFYNGRVCHPCARYCHSCSGPKPVDCHQCTHGAQYQPHNSSCIMIVNNTPDQGGAFFYVAITAIVFVGLVFVILFIRSWSGCSWFRMSEVSYKYLPTGDGSVDQLDSTEEYRDDPNDSESDQPKAQFHSKGVMNGHAPNNGYIVNSKPDRLMNDVISS